MRDRLSNLSNDQLIDAFVQLGIAQSEAAEVVDTSRYNRLAFQLSEIADELKQRPGDQRSALVVLLAHPNLQVRFSAATRLMAVMPKEARYHIEKIADTKHDPTAGTASTYHVMLDHQSKPATT